MGTKENCATIQRFFIGINERSTDVLEEVMHEDLVWHGNHDFGIYTYRRDLHGMFAAFPDAKWTIEDMIAKGDKVVVRWTFEGTQTGAWDKLPATGRHVEYGGASICRISDDRIIEVWNHENLLGLCRQLGYRLVPPKK